MAVQEQYSNLSISSLNGAINAIQTNLTIQGTDAGLFPTSAQFRLKVHNELMLCSGVATPSGVYHVTRGIEGTTAAAHSGLSVIRHLLTAASHKSVSGHINLMGLLSARPAAGCVGRLYWGTDTSLMYRDNGVSWDTVSVAGGGGGSNGFGDAIINTDEAQVSNTTWGDLATVGPQVTLNVTGTVARINLSAKGRRPGGGGGFTGWIGVAVSGATTIAASNGLMDGGAFGGTMVGSAELMPTRLNLQITGLTPGLNSFIMKYQNDGGGAWNFRNRWISVYAP